jgi:hypothetical protein
MKKDKTLRVPVTAGLKDLYAMDMRMAYQAALWSKFNVVAFSRLATAISVVRTALENNQTRTSNALETLDAAIVTLIAIRSRGDQTDVWEITESEQPSILNGIDMAEQCIGTLDVALLEQTAAGLLHLTRGD